MAEKRKPITKKVRFEVFKRDSFKCQYCGRSTPEVILEVDHIVPIAEGGDNRLFNLITSCRDCNRGKGKTPLSDVTAADRQRKQLEEMNEIREQTEMLLKWKRDLMQLEEKQIDAIDEYLNTAKGISLSEDGRRNMRTYIKRFGFPDVYEAVEIAFDKYSDHEQAFRKIGGICYNRQKARL